MYLSHFHGRSGNCFQRAKIAWFVNFQCLVLRLDFDVYLLPVTTIPLKSTTHHSPHVQSCTNSSQKTSGINKIMCTNAIIEQNHFCKDFCKFFVSQSGEKKAPNTSQLSFFPLVFTKTIFQSCVALLNIFVYTNYQNQILQTEHGFCS